MRPFEWIVERLVRWCRPVWTTMKPGNWNDPSIWRMEPPRIGGRLQGEIVRLVQRLTGRRFPAGFYRTRCIKHPVSVTGQVSCEELIFESGPIYLGMEDSLTVTGIG